MEIIWSPLALQDIEEIGDFIAQDNPINAVSFINNLLTSIERLIDYPESGAIVVENPVFRQIVYEGYRLIYQLRLEKILIITILGPGQTFT